MSPNALQSFLCRLCKIGPFRKKWNQRLTKRLGRHYMASLLQSGSSAKTKINMTETDTDRQGQRHAVSFLKHTTGAFLVIPLINAS